MNLRTDRQMVAMRDGIRLETDVIRPDRDGPLPVLLARCVYGIDRVRGEAERFAKEGYAVVIQNPRGRAASEGEPEGGRTCGEDAFDTMEWIQKQSWSNGRIGTFGGSALGIAQVTAAACAHPAHRAMSPQKLPFGLNARLGGAFMFSQFPMWLHYTHSGPDLRPYTAIDWMPLFNRLPVADVLEGVEGAPVDLCRRRILEPHADDFLGGMPPEFVARIDTPCLLVSGWFDHCLTGCLDLHAMIQRVCSTGQRANTHLVLGPWDHSCSTNSIDEYNFGPEADCDHWAGDLAFFNQHVKEDTSVAAPPPVRIFVMGRNVWREESEYPLARAVATKLYLRANGDVMKGGGAGTLSATPPEDESPDSFVYDPADPVPTVGGATAGPSTALPMKRGPRDQAETLRRKDVLLYAGEPLKEPLEVTGPLKLVLYAASSAKDTDFTAKLMAGNPDGDWMLIQDGIVRARYRHGLEEPNLLEPGAVKQYEIDLWHTSYEFQPGQRIGLAISSSNFPRFNRNLNTGGDNERDARFVCAEQTIFHDQSRPSHLVLPVIPQA